MLNNDIVGNSKGLNGKIDDKTVRVFSEGIRATETPQMAAARRSNGGELDSPSRNLSRYMATHRRAAHEGFPRPHDLPHGPLWPRRRPDAHQEAGFPAIRVTEGAENWNHQHQNIRTENGVFYRRHDRVRGLRLSRPRDAPQRDDAWRASPRRRVRHGKCACRAALSDDTTVRWTPGQGPPPRNTSSGGAIRPRRSGSTARKSRARRPASSSRTSSSTTGSSALQAVSADGYASPIQFAGLLGAFIPGAPPPARRQLAQLSVDRPDQVRLARDALQLRIFVAATVVELDGLERLAEADTAAPPACSSSPPRPRAACRPRTPRH